MILIYFHREYASFILLMFYIQLNMNNWERKLNHLQIYDSRIFFCYNEIRIMCEITMRKEQEEWRCLFNVTLTLAFEKRKHILSAYLSPYFSNSSSVACVFLLELDTRKIESDFW